MRLLSAVKTWQRQKTIQIDRADKAQIPAVVAAGIAAIVGTKRTFSPITTARKATETVDEHAAKRRKLHNASALAVAFSLVHN